MDPKESALQAAQRMAKKYGIKLTAHGGSINMYHMKTNADVTLVVDERRSGMVLSFSLFPPKS